jgi:2-C-methyl-D-erythritol 4-phosphate cytidylyltransferase
MTVKQNVWAIVPAGGSGLRMGANRPKQYLVINGRTVLDHTLSRLCDCDVVDGVVAGISAQDPYWEQHEFIHKKFLGTSSAGNERSITVRNALEYLGNLDFVRSNDWALVHDAVRPCVVQDDIVRLVDVAMENQTGAVLGSRLTDTVKSSNDADAASGTIERDHYWRAFTPQVFRIAELANAIDVSIREGVKITDESMAMERVHRYAELVQGHPGNIKITLPPDLELAEMFLEKFY